MKIKDVYQGYLNKLHALDKILKKHKIKKEHVLYIGDGYVDIPVMEKVGFSISVPNAHKEVKDFADYVTEKYGGQGVIVEVAQYLLKSKGIYKQVFNKMKKYIYEA